MATSRPPGGQPPSSTSEMEALVSAQQQTRLNNLNAKLHQGHDPDSAHKQQGTLLGSVPYTVRAREGAFAPRPEDGQLNQLAPAAGIATAFSQSDNTITPLSTNGRADNGTLRTATAPNDLASQTIAFTPPGTTGTQSSTNGTTLRNGNVGRNAFSSADDTIPAALSFRPSAPQGTNIRAAQAFLPSGTVASSDSSATTGTSPASASPTDNTQNEPPPPPSLQAPVLQITPFTGQENISFTVPVSVQADSTITTILITGLPSGATLSAGTQNSDGSWTLTPAELQNLTLTPPTYWSGDFTLTITATANDGTQSASNAISLPVTIEGIATTPLLSVQSASGAEDTAIPLAIGAGLVDNDGSETLSIVITGVPADATLSAGVKNQDGSWTLTPAELQGLTLTPALHYSGDFTLNVTATSNENGTSASASLNLPISVTGVATMPNLSVAGVSGVEDVPVALDINAALVDTDGSETLSIIISGLPSGASLSAGTQNQDGSWTLTPAQLSGLMLTPPLHASGDFTLTVTAVSTEGNSSISNSQNLAVSITGSATAPLLMVPAASGNEDTAIALNINAALVDTDGSETLSITINGVPQGGSLSAGTRNPDGSWTLSPQDLSGLTFTPPLHASGQYTLAVTATSTEGLTTSSTIGSLVIDVAGMATAPSLSTTAVQGSEDSAILLPINAALVDTDGSENLSIVISGVPNGATLSAGTQNSDGIWTLTPAELQNLTLTAPANWSGDISLQVTAISTENGSTAQTSAPMVVTISGNADTPTLAVSSASGNEDNAITLNISAALTDTDGSETLAITITGVPNGAMLSAGVKNQDGSWTLTPAELANLTLTPPMHASGDFTLTVTATSLENGTASSVSSSLPVSIAGQADAPDLNVTAASGNEDTAISLSISSALVDTDGSENLTIVIGNIPQGATLSAGSDNHDGTWTLTPGQLQNLTLTPPPSFSGTLSLSITATASENGTQASTLATLPVTIQGIATAPILTVQSASGNEDTAIPLSISSALTDTDGSETLSIRITGVPGAATLSAGTKNQDGSWTLTPAQLSGLTLTPAVNYSGNFTLTIAATASESGTTSTTVSTLPVSVLGVADKPTLVTAAATGNEDSSIPLSINAVLTDTDGSENLSIVVTGVPAAATLSAGTKNNDGSWSLTPAQLQNLTLTPPANYSGSFNLTVTATASEGGTTATTTATLPVSIIGVADKPNLSVQAASGNEDTAIPLSISSALTDTDGSESLSISITGVPSGATLSAGTRNQDGSWTLTPAQLQGLTLTPPVNYSGSFNLAVTATSSETGTASTAVSSSTLGVTVLGVADKPTLSVQAASGNEDTAIPLSINAALTDTDGSESLSVTIAGVPSAATLSAGTKNPNGSWTLTPVQLQGLTLTPPANYSGSFMLSVTATASETGTTSTTVSTLPVNIAGVADKPTLTTQTASGNEDTAIPLSINSALTDIDGSETLAITVTGVPPAATLSAGTKNQDGSWTLMPAQLNNLTLTPAANYSGNFTLTVTATASENGTASSTVSTLPVTVTGVADKPTLSVQPASGNEDTAIPLSISSALTDTDGSETLSIAITGVPAAATLSAGTKNQDGSWTLTPAQLNNLTLTPASNYSGSFNLTVTAIASENSTTSTTVSTLPVTVAGVADKPTLTVQAASGNEDTSIPLSITSALADTDGSEPLAITITGVPSAATLSAGTKNQDGSWTLTPAQLSGLTLTPAANYSGNFNLTVTATASEGGTTATSVSTLPVTVAGVADKPTLTTQAASGNEDTAIPLSISSALTDTDGSETLTVTITGVPSAATLSAGTKNQDGSWTLTPAQLSGLTLTPATNYSGSFNLTVNATASENGSTSTTISTLPVTVLGVADAPTLTASAATGNEDTAIALSISAALKDTDGSESMSITITGVPSTATLSAGTKNANGSWTLTPAQLSGLTLTPTANYSGSLSLTVTATSTEGSSSASTTVTLPVTVGAVADAPALTVAAASGKEDTAVSLPISAALADTDGSETLSVIITGVPSAATLSAGTKNPDGSWTLTPAQLSSLTLTPAANSDADFTLTVAATSREANGSVATTTKTMAVTVSGVADTPSLSVTAASGIQGKAIPLSISSALTDTDGSETLSITISGVPSGAMLSAGTKNANGSWTLTPAQLKNLTITPRSSSDEDFTLTVTATATEDGTTASQTAKLDVVVQPAASAPELSVKSESGKEDQTISLNIKASLTGEGNDGNSKDNGHSSDQISAVISNVPSGAKFSDGTYAGNGKWSFTDKQLSGLKFIPPEDYSGTLNLTVTAVNTVGGAFATTSKTLTIALSPEVDAPSLNVSAASGREDTFIPLNINATLNDTDGSETLTAVITNVPSGATLSAGTKNANGSWSLTGAQLQGLSIKPPANSDADFTLTVTITATESDGSTSSTNASIPVTVIAVADVPTVTASNATGSSGAQIALTLSGAVTDTDGSESLTYIIQGMPDGFALNQGHNNGDNTWTVKAAQLSGLKLITPSEFTGTLKLYATSVSHDNDNTVQMSTPAPFTVAIGSSPGSYLIDLGVGVNIGGIGAGAQVGVGQSIELFPSSGTLLGVGGVRTKEDTSVALNDAPSLLNLPVLNGLTGLVSKVVFSGIPTGTTFSAGTNKGSGVWEFSPTQLTGLTMTPAANSDVDFTIAITAKVTGITLPISLVSTSVKIFGVADLPTVSVSGSGTEDNATPINISRALTDTDGSETLSLTISGLPSGFTLNKGTDNGNGTWSIASEDVAGLSLIPSANFSGTATFTISAVSTEREGDQAVRQQTVSVNFTPVIDAPVITNTALSGTEDQPLPFNIGLGLTDTDGSEYLSNITVSNVPTGASLTNATNNGNGTWSIAANQLANVQFVPPSNWSGDLTLNVNARSNETGTGQQSSISSSINIHIEAAADKPVLSATDASGDHDSPISLNVAAALADTDGSEKLSVVISGVPEGGMLSAGLNNGDGSWTLTSSQLNGLKFTPPALFGGDISLTATAYSMESGNLTTNSTQKAFSVHVESSAEMLKSAAASADWGSISAANENGWLSATEDGKNASADSVTANDADHSAAAALGTDDSASVNHDSGKDYDLAFHQQQAG